MPGGSEKPDGITLARLRKAAGLTQAQLAEKAGLSERTIIRAEQGTPVRMRAITSAADALLVPPDDLREFEYDVFLSYSVEDKEWVRGELLSRLERAGLKVCIDFRDFLPGVPSVIECVRGVKASRRTVIVMTPRYVERGWAEFERIKIETLDLANREASLIPVYRETCRIPEEIDHFTYVDFRADQDLELAWRKLLTALGRAPERPAPGSPHRGGWNLAHPYPMPPDFTGRAAERAMLSRWLNEDTEHPVLSLRALGGFGKSALAWYWLTHDVERAQWPRVLWWSFYEGDVRFDAFLDGSLAYLSDGRLNARELGPKNAVDALLRHLREPGTLLVLDGFERTLRAFAGMDAPYQGNDGREGGAGRECVSPFAARFLASLAAVPGFRSKMLLTTRLTPRELEARGGGLLAGAQEHELTQLDSADAVKFFVARGIRGTRAEIEAACEPFGYHPLSLALLTGVIVNDLRRPGDIAVAFGLGLDGDPFLRRNRVLEAAYESLSGPSRTLLSRIACFRWPVTYDMLSELVAQSDESVTDLDAALHDLVARGLLQHDKGRRSFDLHPIVRRYAYSRLGQEELADAHKELRDFFENVPQPEQVESIDDLMPTIELFVHTALAGRFDDALNLFRSRLFDALFYQLGAYGLVIELVMMLFPDGEEGAAALRDRESRSYSVNCLALALKCGGQPGRAIPLYERCIASDEEGMSEQLLDNLGNLALAEIITGSLWRAESLLVRTTELAEARGNTTGVAIGSVLMALLQEVLGDHNRAACHTGDALSLFGELGDTQGQGLAWAHRANSAMKALRSGVGGVESNTEIAIAAAGKVLELADETARTRYPHERDFVEARWLLGAAHRVAGDHAAAEAHLNESMERCRRINLVELEGDILIDLARLRRATGQPEEALRLANEARDIAERCGYVLQLADSHIELAYLARDRGDTAAAIELAKQAREFARCDGPPDYTYKAAWVESGRLLEELGETPAA